MCIPNLEFKLQSNLDGSCYIAPGDYTDELIVLHYRESPHSPFRHEYEGIRSRILSSHCDQLLPRLHDVFDGNFVPPLTSDLPYVMVRNKP